MATRSTSTRRSAATATATATTAASANHITTPARAPSPTDMALQSLTTVRNLLEISEGSRTRERVHARDQLADMELLLTATEAGNAALVDEHCRLAALYQREQDLHLAALKREEELARRLRAVEEEKERLRGENEGLRKRRREEREEVVESVEGEGDDEVVFVMERPVKNRRRRG